MFIGILTQSNGEAEIYFIRWHIVTSTIFWKFHVFLEFETFQVRNFQSDLPLIYAISIDQID